MDIFAIILFILFVLLSEAADKKKRRQRAERAKEQSRATKTDTDSKDSRYNASATSRFGFEIPEIAGAPLDADRQKDTCQIERELQRQLQVAARKQRERSRKQFTYAQPARTVRQTDTDSVMQTTAAKSAPFITPEQAISAVALAEILGSPRAYRRRRF